MPMVKESMRRPHDSSAQEYLGKLLFHSSIYSYFFNSTTTNSYNPKNAGEDLFRFLILVPMPAIARMVTCRSEDNLNVLFLGFHV